MSERPPNPFQPPSPGPGEIIAAPSGLRYFEAYTYLMSSPNWAMTLLLGTVCQLIPVIGPLVLMGYQFEIIEALYRRPQQTYPDFSFDRFVEYLTRGLWPFLVSLVVSLVITLPAVLACYVAMGAMVLVVSEMGDQAGLVVGLVVMIVSVLAVLGIGVVVAVIMLPLVLRAGLSADFAAAFHIEFLKSFISKVWREIVLSTLFMMISGMIIAFAGLAVFCIGVYVAATWIVLAQAHMYYQLYMLYLARGGEAVPLPAPAKPLA